MTSCGVWSLPFCHDLLIDIFNVIASINFIIIVTMVVTIISKNKKGEQEV